MKKINLTTDEIVNFVINQCKLTDGELDTSLRRTWKDLLDGKELDAKEVLRDENYSWGERKALLALFFIHENCMYPESYDDNELYDYLWEDVEEAEEETYYNVDYIATDLLSDISYYCDQALNAKELDKKVDELRTLYDWNTYNDMLDDLYDVVEEMTESIENLDDSFDIYDLYSAIEDVRDSYIKYYMLGIVIDDASYIAMVFEETFDAKVA